MDAAILAIAIAAQGDHRRPAIEVDLEFILDCMPQLVAGKLRGEFGKGGTAGGAIEWIASVPPQFGKIVNQGRATFCRDEILDNHEIEWVALQRARPQPLEIEQGQSSSETAR